MRGHRNLWKRLGQRLWKPSPLICALARPNTASSTKPTVNVAGRSGGAPFEQSVEALAQRGESLGHASGQVALLRDHRYTYAATVHRQIEPQAQSQDFDHASTDSSMALVSVGSVGTTVGRPLEGASAAPEARSLITQCSEAQLDDLQRFVICQRIAVNATTRS